MKITNDLKKYGVEWLILRDLVKSIAWEDSNTLLHTYFKENKVDWGILIEQSMRHKLFPMLAWKLSKDEFFDYLPPFVNQYFRLAIDTNIHKGDIIRAEAERISQALQSKNIRFAGTKGIILESEIYGNEGYKFMSDIDFIIEPKDKLHVMDILRKLGYFQGTVDWKANKARRLSREEHLIFLNTKDKVPEHIIEIDDSIISYVSVGFAMGFTWASCEYQVPIDESLTKIINVKDNVIPSMSRAYHFLYIILHLFKHAWVEHLQKWQNDVNIIRFADTLLFWEKFKNEIKDEVKTIIIDNHLNKPVIWVLKHLDDIFDTNIVNELELDKIDDDNWYQSAGDKSGNVRIWNGNMIDRLWVKDKLELFNEKM